MKKIIINLIFIFILIQGYTQNNNNNNNNNNSNNDVKNKYIFNDINQYIIAELNKLDNYYRSPCLWENKKFGQKYLIFDLTDSIYIDVHSLNSSFYFLDSHVYYISSNNRYCNLAIIMILVNGSINFFEGLNCKSCIHDPLNVISWINQNNIHITEDIKYRIINFEKYTNGYATDPFGYYSFCKYKKYLIPFILKKYKPTVKKIK
jgi:hypothetical protein